MSKANGPKEFWEKVDRKSPEECWEWKGYINQNGYGHIRIYGKGWYAHRYAYFLWKFDLSPNWCILHKCDNPKCCNPYHLFHGTRLDNNTDMRKKERQTRKLTDEEIVSIRNDTFSTNKELATKHKVSDVQIGNIRKGVSWSDRYANFSDPKTIRKNRSDTYIRGINHGMSKLTEDDVREIRKSSLNNEELAKIYGLTRRNIRLARIGITWKHVK